MAFEYNKLRGKIIELFKTQGNFAIAMGWSERTLSLKLNCKIAWKQTEICKAIQLLDLSYNDIQAYFFETKVQNIEQ